MPLPLLNRPNGCDIETIEDSFSFRSVAPRPQPHSCDLPMVSVSPRPNF